MAARDSKWDTWLAEFAKLDARRMSSILGLDSLVKKQIATVIHRTIEVADPESVVTAIQELAKFDSEFKYRVLRVWRNYFSTSGSDDDDDDAKMEGKVEETKNRDKRVAGGAAAVAALVAAKTTTPAAEEKTDLRDLVAIRELGKGNYGVVTLMRHRLTGDTFAVKEINLMRHSTARQQAFARQAAIRECEVLKYLRKECEPYFLCTTDCHLNCANTKAYVITRFLGSYVDLFTWITVNQSSSAWRVAPEREQYRQLYTVCRNLCIAVKKLHDLGVAHRDLKPANCMVEAKSCNVRLIDFGFACIRLGGVAATTIPEGLVASCAVLPRNAGTPSYMAPELNLPDNRAPLTFIEREANAWIDYKQADIWAVGATMFAIFTRANPPTTITSYSYQELVAYHINKLKPQPRSADTMRLWDLIVMAINNALHEDPSRRALLDLPDYELELLPMLDAAKAEQDKQDAEALAKANVEALASTAAAAAAIARLRVPEIKEHKDVDSSTAVVDICQDPSCVKISQRIPLALLHFESRIFSTTQLIKELNSGIRGRSLAGKTEMPPYISLWSNSMKTYVVVQYIETRGKYSLIGYLQSPANGKRDHDLEWKMSVL